MKNPLGRLQSPQIFFVRIWTPPFIRSAHLRPKKIYACHKFFYGLRAKTFFKSFRQPTMMSRRPASSVFLHGRVKECSRPAAVYKFSDPSRKFRPTLRNPWDDNTVGAGGLHFISGARRGMNELRLQGRPTVQHHPIYSRTTWEQKNSNRMMQLIKLILDGESGLCHVVGPVHDIRLMNSLSC